MAQAAGGRLQMAQGEGFSPRSLLESGPAEVKRGASRISTRALLLLRAVTQSFLDATKRLA